MLFISLILSLVMLALLNITAFSTRSILASLPWCGLGLAGLGFFMFVLPWLLLHAALSLVVGLLCVWLAPRPRPFLGATIGAFLVSYTLFGVHASLNLSRLQRENSSQSLAERLAYENGVSEDGITPNLPPDVHLISLPGEKGRSIEKEIEQMQEYPSQGRVDALRMLHEDQVAAFVDSAGFGVGRGARPLQFTVPLPEEDPIPINEPESSIPAESAATLALVGGNATLDKPTSKNLSRLHQDSVIDFVNVEGFGYVKDRKHVYGFQPHRFSRNPAEALAMKPWRFRNLELVSLLKHGRPAVYLSRNLPRMSELRKAPTRELDTFEAAALPRLKSDDLVIHATGQRLRVLGSIRAAEACLACHAGKQGTLLGAFSYHLDRGEP